MSANGSYVLILHCMIDCFIRSGHNTCQIGFPVGKVMYVVANRTAEV